MPHCAICSGQNTLLHWQKDGYELYKCSTCTHIFVWPNPAELNQLYAESYFIKGGDSMGVGYADYDADKEPMYRLFEKYLEKLEALTSGRSLLDIGAATGYFLDIARKRGWKTFGVEISHFAFTEASRRGHRMYVGELPQIDIEESFDVITMWDVLEHVQNPHAYLKKAAQLLKPGGYIAINTVDNGSYWARFWGSRWHLVVPPEHLNYFSLMSLSRLLINNGFNLIDVGKHGKRFSLAYICTMLNRWQKIDIWQRVGKFFDSPFWRKFSIPINFYDNVFVIARKK